MKRLAAAFGLAVMAAVVAVAHENHSPYDAPGVLWQLSEIDGKPFAARALLEFPGIGRISGQAPCNRFSGEFWSAYPWFDPGPLSATRRACPDLAEEDRFFEALERMTLAEADHEFLILTDDARGSMVFIQLTPGG